MYTLKINDTTIENLAMNGNNYVSDTEVDTSSWPAVFSLTATDEEGNVTEEIPHARLIQQVQYAWDDNKFYLAFAPVSEQEVKNAELRAQIEYLAMMTDVDIDE
jgi:hypothetical protein